MVVNFEFLGSEPIENVITCMNYQVGKVVFFGYQEMIDLHRKSTEKFLKKYCGVQQVVFHALSHENLPAILKAMRKAIDYEKSQKSSIYFDITGGENLILVAFGILSKECEARMHYYDVERNKLIELEEGAKGAISREVSTQQVKFDLDNYIQLMGGIINYTLHKEGKAVKSKQFAEDVEKIWSVARKYWDYWNPFSMFLRENLKPDETLAVCVKESDIQRALAFSKTKLKKLSKLNEILDALRSNGAIKRLERSNGTYRFAFKNQQVKDCLWDGGSILELYTYQKERKRSDDCRIGVHIDWDGVIHSKDADVLNEIDVLVMRDNIPVFMSCKSGNMGAGQALQALYELETVAGRFGGKYAKKVLVATRSLGKAAQARALEMGIEVRKE